MAKTDKTKESEPKFTDAEVAEAEAGVRQYLEYSLNFMTRRGKPAQRAAYRRALSNLDRLVGGGRRRSVAA